MRNIFLAAVTVSALVGAPAFAQNANGANNGTGSTANTTDNGPNTNGMNTTANPPATNGMSAGANTPPGANPNGANPPANAPRAAQNTTNNAQQAAQNVPANGPNFIHLQNSDMLSSNIVGLDIYNGQNNNIGKIQDIAIDSSKKVTGYILSVGGFLGMGTHYVAVDPSAVNITYDGANKTWRASMKATRDQLKSAPEFKYGGQWTASRS